MKRATPLLISIAAIALLAAVSAAALESVHMRDGSLLQGEVVSLDAERLILRTAYSDGLELPRAQIAAIVLDDGFVLQGGPAAAPPREDAPVVLNGTGTLEITFTGREVRSSMRYKHNRDRDRILEATSIEIKVFADDDEVYRFVDDEMDKEFLKGRETYVRNTCNLEPIRIELPAGEHDIRICVSNRVELTEVGENRNDLVTAELLVEQLMMKPDRTTRLVVKGHGSRLGYGDFSMELLTTR